MINNPHAIYHSLWYTCGDSYECHENKYQMHNSNKKLSMIIASEPLTTNTASWVEVLHPSVIIARGNVPEGVEIFMKRLDME